MNLHTLNSLPQDTNQSTGNGMIKSNPFTNIPKITKGIVIVLVIMYLIGLIFPSIITVTALIPGYTIPPHFYIWNVITSGYMETNFVNALVNILGLVFLGNYLEPTWGSKEFIYFVVVVNALSGVASFFLMAFMYPLFPDPGLWFHLRLCGFSSVISGFSVALKQLIPEQEFNLMFGLSVRAKHFPSILLLTNLAFFVLGLPSESFPFTFFGIAFGWIYLRFFQVRVAASEGGIKVIGDLSDSFSLASFFPEPVQPIIRILSNIVFNTLKACNCCNGVSSSNNNAYSASTLGDSLDSERRRARALRALDQRIQMQDFHLNQNVQADISSSKRDISDAVV